MKAAIVLDDWKLPIFKRHLNDAGFEYTQFSGPTQGCITLTVITEDAARLGEVVRTANIEAKKISTTLTELNRLI